MSRSILAIADKPGWSVDNQVSQVIAGLPQFSWTKVFHYQTPESLANLGLAKLGAAHDLIWCANHSTGHKFLKDFEALNHPRVLVTFRSWRYKPEAISFIQSGLVKGVTAISHDLADHLGAHFNPVRYISDSVPEFFRPSRPRRIGFVGVPDEYKGFPMIAEAVKRCGFELVSAIRPTKHGAVSYRQDAMPSFYESCDALVVASEQEGSGSILLEAMAMNVPALTTRVGVATELDCLHVDRTVEGIEAGLRRLFGRDQVFPEFSVDAVNKKYAQLFEDILK